MELKSFQYYEDKGWTVNEFPPLDSENTLIIVFAAPEYLHHSDPIAELGKFYSRSKMIGCSSAGEIIGPNVCDKSISVAVTRFEHTNTKVATAEIQNSEQSSQAGNEIAKKLLKDDLKGIFLLSEGLNVNGSELIRGVNSVVNNNIIVTGGLAGDGDKFKQTWAIVNGEIKKNTVVAVGFYGDHIQIGHGSRGGWDVFGPERVITRSKNNILYELDNKPALSLYKEYLGDRASGLPATGLLFPLAIRKNREDERQLVRTILAIDEKAQALIFAGDVPMGYWAQLMRANFDRLILGATEAAELASEQIKNNLEGPLLAIAISCVGRRLLLGKRIDEETESTFSNLPKGTQQVGFYSYGELSPFASGNCDLHNQTMTLTLLSEK